MLTWLAGDLAANTNDWLIAFWHSPPYSHGSHNSDNREEFNLVEMRQNAVPILESYGVDLVLCGHSHSYERSFLLDGHYDYSTNLVPTMIKDAGSGRTGDTGAYMKSGTGPAPSQGAVYVVNGSSGWAIAGDTPLDHPVMCKSLLRTGSFVLDVDHNRLDAKFLSETELTRTAPWATPHHSSAGAPRAERIAPLATRRTTARSRIAWRSAGESLENHEPVPMFDCSSSVRTGACIVGR
jgi:hypothetical protein